MKLVFVGLIVLMGLTFESLAFETGCSLQPSELNPFGTKVAKIVSDKNTSMPRNIPLQSEFEISQENGVRKYYGTFEGFFRPKNDDFISIIPLPILGFDLSKDRVVLYVCAHYTDNPAESHLTIYFLRGYHLDPLSTSNFVGNILFKPQLNVKAVPATLLGIGEIKLFFIQIFRYIPFVDLYFETFSLVQRFFANLLGDVTGFGVERIELTDKFFRVSSGVNLNSPRNARITKTFTLKKPDLGVGAKSKTFKADDEKVISDLEKTAPAYDVKTEIQEIP